MPLSPRRRSGAVAPKSLMCVRQTCLPLPSQRFGPTHRTIVEAGVGEASAADAARGQRDGGDLFVLVARHI